MDVSVLVQLKEGRAYAILFLILNSRATDTEETVRFRNKKQILLIHAVANSSITFHRNDGIFYIRTHPQH